MDESGSAKPAAERDEGGRDAALDARILRMRKDGASWLEIQQACGLTRQQVRYAYQRGLREERRARRRAP
jgi:hypothetical protein